MLDKDYVYCRTHETQDRAQNYNYFRGIEGALPWRKLIASAVPRAKPNWEQNTNYRYLIPSDESWNL